MLAVMFTWVPSSHAQTEKRNPINRSEETHVGAAITSPNIGGEGTLDVLAGGGSSVVWSYDILSNTWRALEEAPRPVRSGGAISNLFSNCDYAFSGDGTSFFAAGTICRTPGQLADAPAPVGAGAALAAAIGLVGSPVDSVFALRGAGTSDFWQYSISQNTWKALPSVPAPVGEGAALVEVASASDFQVAALRGGGTSDFWLFDIAGDRWLTNAAPTPAPVGSGASVAQLQRLGRIYVLRGDGTTDFWVFESGRWTALAGTPSPVNAGGALVGINYGTDSQRDELFALAGGNSSAIWKYDVASNTWTPIAELPRWTARGAIR